MKKFTLILNEYEVKEMMEARSKRYFVVLNEMLTTFEKNGRLKIEDIQDESVPI